VGIALNGVFLFSGTSEYGYDAFFPKAYGNMNSPQAVSVDICLGTAWTYNTYRYYSFSPCIFEGLSIKTVSAPCSSSLYPECGTDVRAYALSQVPLTLQTMIPIGIAKDGRIIYGPFKTDGSLWQPCDVDVCNGVKEGDIYYYVSTMFHPYLVGCFGPGNDGHGLSASCSANARVCDSTTASNARSTSSYFQALMLVLGLLYVLSL